MRSNTCCLQHRTRHLVAPRSSFFPFLFPRSYNTGHPSLPARAPDARASPPPCHPPREDASRGGCHARSGHDRPRADRISAAAGQRRLTEDVAAPRRRGGRPENTRGGRIPRRPHCRGASTALPWTSARHRRREVGPCSGPAPGGRGAAGSAPLVAGAPWQVAGAETVLCSGSKELGTPVPSLSLPFFQKRNFYQIMA